MGNINVIAKINFGILLFILIVVVGILLKPFIDKAIKKFLRKNTKEDVEEKEVLYTSALIADVVVKMSEKKIGALIIFEGQTPLEDFLTNTTTLNSELSQNLIYSIFSSKSAPLHDGALVITDNKIKYAGAFIEVISTTKDIGAQYGTRHRSGTAITEKTDSFAVFVSEESGNISLSENGEIRNININNVFIEISRILNNRAD